MKKTFLLFISFPLLYANSLALVHYDPFYKSQKILHTLTAQRTQNKSLVLSAIFNNQAFINNKFYALGEKIQGYKIKKIYKQAVVLRNHKSLKILHLQQKQHLFTLQSSKRDKK